MPKLVGSLDLLRPGAVTGLVALRRSSILRGIGLDQFRPDLGGVDEGDRIAFVNHLTFFYIEFLNPSGNLSGDPVLTCLGLALDH